MQRFLIIFLLAAPARADLILEVIPRDLDSGYRVAGGTITVERESGVVGPADFGSWSIDVTGPEPFTFTELNSTVQVRQNVFLENGELITQAIFVPGVTADPGDVGSNLRFRSSDRILDFNSNHGDWENRVNYFLLGDPLRVYEVTFPRSHEYPGLPLKIAAVPEPSALALLAVAAIITLTGRRIQSARTRETVPPRHPGRAAWDPEANARLGRQERPVDDLDDRLRAAVDHSISPAEVDGTAVQRHPRETPRGLLITLSRPSGRLFYLTTGKVDSIFSLTPAPKKRAIQLQVQ